jgi:uncharacterized membrane protein
MRTLLRHFAQGALIAVPIAVTLYVVFTLVTFVDGLLHFGIPGLGLFVTLALLTLLGFIASSVIGTRLIVVTEAMLRRLPLVKILYSAIRDLVGAFVGDRKGFDRPVLVHMPGGDVKLFGFATRDLLPFAGLERHVAVYFPQSYNFAGNVVAVPKACVTPLDVKSSEFMSFVISGGIAGFPAGGAVGEGARAIGVN